MNDATRAVIFEPRDYATGPRRLVSLAIDMFISITLISTPIAMATALWVSPETQAIVGDHAKRQRLTYEELGPSRFYATMAVTLLLPVAYHIGLRLTPLGTLGYFLTRIRLVGVDGRRPKAPRILKRFAISLIGLFTFGAIYLSCFKRERHQAMHDLFAGTWLVRRAAKTIRPAQVIYKTRLLGTYPMTHIDIEEFDPAAQAPCKSDATDAVLNS
jgi:uncharacterized RDD family membrane protein YckC